MPTSPQIPNPAPADFHLAAIYGTIGRFPPELITPEVLMAKNLKDESVAFLAARYGYFDQLPQASVTNEVLDTPNGEDGTTREVLEQKAQQKAMEAMRAERAKEGKYADGDERLSDLRYAVMYNQVELVPTKKMTTEAVMVKDEDGNNILHTAVSFGTLESLPVEVISDDALRATNNAGLTPENLMTPLAIADLEKCRAAKRSILQKLELLKGDIKAPDTPVEAPDTGVAVPSA